MASIEKRTRSGRVRWYARYRDADHLQRTKTFDRKVDAERFMTTVGADLLRGTYVAPDDGRMTFGEYATQWAAIQQHRPATVDQVERHLRLHVLPVIGSRPLASIRASEVQALVRTLSDSLSPSTVRVVHSRVVAVFSAAVRDRRIASSPCAGIRLPRVTKAPVVPLGTETVQALIEAVPSRYRAVVVLAAGTGLRQGELFGLDVEHIDFLRRQVRIDRQLISLSGVPTFGPPKTAASVRTVPLPTVVLEALSAHVGVYGPGWEGLMFTTESGKAIWRSSWSHVWTKAVRASGAPTGTGLHGLRHYYASLLIRHGESVKTVQARLGHASATETLDVYSHLWPDSEDRTREAVDAVLGCVPVVYPSASSGA